MNRQSIIVGLMLTSATFAAACATGDDPDEEMAAEPAAEAAESLDRAESASAAISLCAAVSFDAAEVAASLSSSEALAEAAASADSNVCAGGGSITVSQEGPTVIYEIDECSSWRGLVSVSGTIRATYAKLAAGVLASVETTGLRINGVLLSASLTSLTTVESATAFAVDAEGAVDATGPFGQSFSFDADLEGSFDEQSGCVAFDAELDAGRPVGSLGVSITGYERCPGVCPGAGGQIVLEGRSDSMTIAFDGTDTASFQTSGGRAGDVPLPFCEPS